MPQLLCEKCKGIWVCYKSFPYPKLCPACLKKEKKNVNNNLDAVLETKTETIDLL